MPINHDVAWHLWLAEQVLAGRALYRDLIEVNPPLVVWLDLPVVWLAARLHLHPHLVFLTLLASGLGVSLVLTFALLPRGRWVAAIGLSLVLGPLAIGDWGQREHLAVGLLLPLLALAIRRSAGRGVPPSLAFLLGGFAGIAIALKPYLAPIWLCLVAYRGPRREDLSVVVTGLLYLVAVLVLTPAYLPLVRLVGPSYFAFGRLGMADLLRHPVPVALGLVTLAWLAARRWGARSPEADVLTLAGLGAWVAVLLQQKGWTYHWYPVAAFGFLAAIATFTAATQLPPGRTRFIAVGLTGGVVLLMVGVAGGHIAAGLELVADRRAAIRDMRAAIRPGDRVVVLSAQLADVWPGVVIAGGEWAGRLPCLWFTQVFGTHRPEEMSPAERRLFGVAVGDVLGEPDRVVVETAARNRAMTGGRSFDLLGYLGQDARVRAVLARYRRVGVVNGLAVLERSR